MPKLASNDPKAILNAARCFDSCVPPGFDNALKTYLLTQVTVNPCVVPTAPVILIVTNDGILTPPYLRVVWAQPANTGSMITSYTVSMGTTPGGPYPLSQTVSAVTFSAIFTTGLLAGTTYYVVAVANSFAGCDSPRSNEGSAKTNGGANGLLTGLLGYWKLDDTSTGAGFVWSDATGNGWGATQTGGANIGSTASGKINGGCSAPSNASASGLTVSKNIDLRAATTPFTVNLWFNDFGDAGGGGVMLSEWNGGTDCWVIRCDSGEKPRFLAFNAAGVNDTDITWGSNLTCCNIAFSMITFGFDGTNSFLAVNNGARMTVVPANVRRGGSDMVFLNYSGFVNNWPGIIDEIGYWNRTLSNTDVANLYNSGAALPFGSFT